MYTCQYGYSYEQDPQHHINYANLLKTREKCPYLSEVVDIENHSKKLTDRETEEKRKFNATFKVNTVKVNNLQKKKIYILHR